MTGVFPTAYFGSIAYFQELVRFDEVVIETQDHFPKQTFRNRCSIKSPQGALRLTLPVEKPSGSKTVTQDVRVSSHNVWRNDHWRAIRSSYAAAPYFDHYGEEIKALIYAEHASLVEFNLSATNRLLGFFGVTINFSYTSEYMPSYMEHDFRNTAFDSEQPEQLVAFPYTQVYFETPGFLPNQSILDLLFCEGPIGRKQLLL